MEQTRNKLAERFAIVTTVPGTGSFYQITPLSKSIVSMKQVSDDDDFALELNMNAHIKLHNISVTPKMVKKILMDLDLSDVSGPSCIPVVVLKNCEPKLSYVLAELFSKCLKESCFGRFHWWSLYLKMLGKGLQVKTTAISVIFLWLIKSLKNF